MNIEEKIIFTYEPAEIEKIIAEHAMNHYRKIKGVDCKKATVKIDSDYCMPEIQVFLSNEGKK